MKKRKTIVVLLGALACLASCGNSNTDTTNGGTTNPGFDGGFQDMTGESDQTSNIPDLVDFSTVKSAAITNTSSTESGEELVEAEPTSVIKIDLSNASSLSIEGVAFSDGVMVISKAGSYELSGSLSGRIEIKKVAVHLFLNNVSINSASSSPLIFKKCSDTSVITLLPQTSNELIDANLETYTAGVTDDDGTYENDATIFAKAPLAINGSGSLNVTSYYHQGIKSKDILKILSGNVTVNSYDNCIKGNDNLYIEGGTLDLTSTAGDGVKTNEPDDGEENDLTLYNMYLGNTTINLDTKYDGIQAYNYMLVDGANLNITAFGGYKNASSFDEDTYSAKGLKSDLGIYFLDGDINIDSADDAINTNDFVFIDDASFEISAGDDGIHADKSLEVNGGTINVNNSYEGLEAAYINMAGGTVSIYASDDGINASNKASTVADGAYDETCQMYFSAGDIYVNADGDGLDSNGNIEVTGGTIVVDGPTNGGNGALDSNGGILVSGGTLVAGGSSGMCEVPRESSTQNVVAFTLTANAKSTIVIKDSSTSEEILTYNPKKNIQALVVSSSKLVLNESYDVYVDGTKSLSFTQSAVVTSSVTNQGGQGGGQPGGRN